MFRNDINIDLKYEVILVFKILVWLIFLIF